MNDRRARIVVLGGAATLALAMCAPAAELTGMLANEPQLARAFAESPDDRALMLAYAGVTSDPLLKRALQQRYERSAVYRARLETVHSADGAEMGAAVRVRVDGRELLLLVDTGATGITLAPGRMQRTGRRIDLIAFGGRVNAIELDGARIGLGELHLAVRSVRLSVSKLPGGIDGVIGTDVFGDFLVRLDYGRGELQLIRDRIATAAWPRMSRHGHLIYVDTRAGEFLLDTGSAVTVLDRPAAGGSTRHLRGAGGDAVAAADLGHACVAVEAGPLCDLNAVAMDLGELRRAGVNVAGLIGYGALKGRVVEIDYRGGRIRFGD